MSPDAAPVRFPFARRPAAIRGVGLAAAIVTATAVGTKAADSLPADEPRAPTDLQLFLLFGLPNLPARGQVEPMDQALHSRVLVMNKGFGWSRQIDPDEWTEAELTHIELAAALGRTVFDGRPGITAGMVPAAFGGTSLDDWMPGTPLYKNAVERVKIAQKDGKLVGMLWYQGPTREDPARAPEYARRFAAMIAQLRADLGIKYVPVIVGEIRLGPAAPAAEVTPLARVPQEVIPCFFVSTDGLRGASAATRLDSSLLWTYSERFAQAWMDLAQP